MGMVDNFKELVGLVVKLDNIELLQKIMELQRDAMSLVQENHALVD